MAVTVYRNIPSDISIPVQNHLQTGLVTGGLITINAGDSTKYDISKGMGYVIDNVTDPENPSFVTVSWEPKIAVALTNLNTQVVTVITIDYKGDIGETVVSNMLPFFRTNIILGSIFHPSGSIFATSDIVSNGGAVNTISSLADLAFSMGNFVKSGNKIIPNGVNLKLNKSSGEVFVMGINFKTNLSNPNIATITASSPVNFIYTWRNGTGGYNTSAVTQDIVPGKYDDGTTSTASPNGTVTSNKWTIHRIYLTAAILVLHYGQDIYNDEAHAIDGIIAESFDANPELEGSIFLGWLIVRGAATDLTLATNSIYIKANRFGSPGSM